MATPGLRGPARLPLCLVLLWVGCGVAFAVDRSKFRTCQQTSFCRRHRSGRSGSLYRYRMEGWTFHGPAAEEGAEAGAGAGAGGGGQDQGTEKQRPQADGLWGSLVTRVLGGDGAAAEGEADPHFRGPPATLTAALVNASPTTSTGGGRGSTFRSTCRPTGSPASA